jgi:sodium-dependent dicarboxylate transporter 2/3/5
MPEPIQIDEHGNIILKINWKRMLKVVIILLLSWGAYYIPLTGLTHASRICLMIFVGAAGFWFTEAIPPFATAIMVIVLNIYLLGQPGGPLGLAGSGVLESYRVFLNPIASPVLVLFFGGFIMAIAATKHGFDLKLAKAFIKPFGTKPSMVLLGVILTTALFSMFMSNTATTAMMFAIFSPLFSHFEERDAFKKALILAIPFSANIGGMGTIIGTPPNAVAASVLNQLGFGISFLKWMIIGVPLVIIMLGLLWLLLIRMFKPKKQKFEILFPESTEMTWDLLLVMWTFAITVLMWITEPLHGIPAAVTALLPVMIFTMFGIIGRDDLKKIEWDVLILVAGGLTLGVSMKLSGLSDILVGQISWENLGIYIVLIMFGTVTMLMSNFMSHTSAANILIPIVTSVAVISPPVGALLVAFTSSLAMSLPISTPPNAIAFATRTVDTREMAKTGTIVSVSGLIVLFFTSLLLLYFAF